MTPGADELNAAVAKLQEVWTHSNKYHAAAACVNCGGVIRHEGWCKVVNSAVGYAFTIVTDPKFLSTRDRLALHGMGVCWCARKCAA